MATAAMDEETDIETYLDKNHINVSILALRMSSRRRLGMYLNQEAMALHNGQLPNYQGLAECIGFEFIEQLSFQRERDPTQAMLIAWGNQPELEPTLGNLVKFLIDLERYDVLVDCKEIIRMDAEHFLKKKAAGSVDINPLQDSTVSQSPFNIDDMQVDETAIMTIQDVEEGRPTYYDAFVCYHPEGDDLKFVKTMIEKVESASSSLKLFVPHRDDLPGASKHVISAKLIQDRCKRMVIVMSPRYLQSEACDFQTKFAHALSPGSRSKKLVPVLVTQCEVPNILRHVTLCDYTRGDMTGWFWDRLIKSLQAPLNAHDITVDNPSDFSSLEMNITSQSASFSPPSRTCSMLSLSSSTGRERSESSPARSGVSEVGATALLQRTPPSSASASPSLGTKRGTGRGGKKKTVVPSPLSSSSPASSSFPSSPSSERKSEPKKKTLKAKLTAVFSLRSSDG